MLQKGIVLGLSVLCLSVWSLVIIQLFKESPQVRADKAPVRVSAPSQLSPPDEQLMLVLSERSNPVEPVSESLDSVKKNGLTYENVAIITTDDGISIDTLLSALNSH